MMDLDVWRCCFDACSQQRRPLDVCIYLLLRMGHYNKWRLCQPILGAVLTFLVFEFYQHHFVGRNRAMAASVTMAGYRSRWLDYLSWHANWPSALCSPIRESHYSRPVLRPAGTVPCNRMTAWMGGRNGEIETKYRGRLVKIETNINCTEFHEAIYLQAALKYEWMEKDRHFVRMLFVILFGHF